MAKHIEQAGIQIQRGARATAKFMKETGVPAMKEHTANALGDVGEGRGPISVHAIEIAKQLNPDLYVHDETKGILLLGDFIKQHAQTIHSETVLKDGRRAKVHELEIPSHVNEPGGRMFDIRVEEIANKAGEIQEIIIRDRTFEYNGSQIFKGSVIGLQTVVDVQLKRKKGLFGSEYWDFYLGGKQPGKSIVSQEKNPPVGVLAYKMLHVRSHNDLPDSSTFRHMTLSYLDDHIGELAQSPYRRRR